MADNGQNIRERYIMSGQAEKVFFMLTFAVLAGFVTTQVVGCHEKSNYKPDEVLALDACQSMPDVKIQVFASKSEDQKAFDRAETEALAKQNGVIDAVAKCRQDALDYYAKKLEPGKK